MTMITNALIPKVPTPPTPPIAPPQPDATMIKQDITNSEQLSKKPKGRQNNILTGNLGDSSFTTGGKTLLGQ